MMIQIEAHGGLNYAELRAANLTPNAVIDFSVNINPFGPSPRAHEALRALDLSGYPDRDTLDLRDRLATLNNVAPQNILIGNGTAELIWLIAHALLRADDFVIIGGPTFGEYERAAHAVGARIIAVNARPPRFALNVEKLITEVESCRPRLLFLCNPNNPTGLFLPDADINRVAERCNDTLFVLDEAYRSFVTLQPFGPPPAPNTIILRSMTKDFALAGLRLGYAIAAPEIVAALQSCQPPWSVNAAAQAAGLAALNDLEHTQRTLAETRRCAALLQTALNDRGARVVPSATHFCLVEVGPHTGAEWRQSLLNHGCLVRNCASFGLPHHIRIGARRPDQNQRLIAAWYNSTQL